jgi:predicted amidohydrolase YtcJ
MSGLEAWDGIKLPLAGCLQLQVCTAVAVEILDYANALKADFDSDDQLKGKYIMLDRVDVHCIWVSESVLSLLPSPFPEVPGGEVIIDPGPGVFCDNAMDAVMQHWPKPDKAKKVGFIKAAQKALNGVGLVGMHDAGVVPENLELYQELASTEDWTVRVYAMLECQKRNTFCGNDVQTFEHSSGMLSMKSVKLFAVKSGNCMN